RSSHTVSRFLNFIGQQYKYLLCLLIGRAAPSLLSHLCHRCGKTVPPLWHACAIVVALLCHYCGNVCASLIAILSNREIDAMPLTYRRFL
ncbi:hypothetical protein, partial [uncultured Bacteroides sp.]|uniref:hypothetical protein n=1 Tax=uncultured Bacteroides sp. TaxID=162156 RepID=UPI0026215FC7